MSRYGLISLLLLLALGCGSNDSAPAPAEPAPAPPVAQPQPQPAPSAAATPAALTDRIDDPTFELALSPSGPYAAGKLGSFALSLTPRGVYHVNQEYPMDVTFQAGDELQLPKRELKKADAATFTEKQAKFDVPFTPTKAGSHRVEAKVKFAVCTPENCMPDERTLALVLPVE